MRECGGCRVCCTGLSIPELEKRAWQPCPHECAAGCAVYATRPRTCAEYRCLWLKEELPAWAWPARTGLVVSRDDPTVPTVNVVEAAAGAARSYWGERLVKYLARAAVVVVAGPTGSAQVRSARAIRMLIAHARRTGATTWPS